MNPALRYLAVLPCLLFILSGLRWLVDPGGAAEALGMPLLEGVGRSTQIGDSGAFFLGCGLMIALGLIRKEKIWLAAPALLVGLALAIRIIATLLHGAPLPAPFIVVEAVTVLLLFISIRATSD